MQCSHVVLCFVLFQNRVGISHLFHTSNFDCFTLIKILKLSLLWVWAFNNVWCVLSCLFVCLMFVVQSQLTHYIRVDKRNMYMLEKGRKMLCYTLWSYIITRFIWFSLSSKRTNFLFVLQTWLPENFYSSISNQ